MSNYQYKNPVSRLIIDSYETIFQNNTYLYLLQCGHHRSNETWGPKVKNHYSIHYVSKGKGYFRSGDKTYHLSEGDIFIIFPGVMGEYGTESKEKWEYYYICFSGFGAENIISHSIFSDKNEYYHFSPEDNMEKFFQNILDSKGYTPRHQADMLGHLYLLLGKLMKDEDIKTEELQYIYLRKAFDYINKVFPEKITIDKLSEAVNISRGYLYKIFIKHTGISPQKYISRYRIEQSLLYLENTSLSISEVAEKVGFSDPLYYSRIFKKIMNVYPSKYRKKENQNS